MDNIILGYCMVVIGIIVIVLVAVFQLRNIYKKKKFKI